MKVCATAKHPQAATIRPFWICRKISLDDKIVHRRHILNVYLFIISSPGTEFRGVYGMARLQSVRPSALATSQKRHTQFR